MAVYHAESLLFGPLAERPALSDPTIYSASGIALFLATDTGGLYETSGSAWTPLGALSPFGITSDAQGNITVAGDLTIGETLTAGDPAQAAVPNKHTFVGQTTTADCSGNLSDGDPVLNVLQSTTLQVGDFGVAGLNLFRIGSIAAADYIEPAVVLADSSESAQPVLQVQKNGATTLEIGAIKSITGALSTVTDPAAKAVLTSIIAALTGIKVATNDTT